MNVGDFVFRREIDLDHVKAKGFARGTVSSLEDRGRGQEVSLLFFIYRGGGAPEGVRLSIGLHAAFDLTEDEGVFCFCDDVDLVFSRGEIAANDAISAAAEIPRRGVLADPAFS